MINYEATGQEFFADLAVALINKLEPYWNSTESAYLGAQTNPKPDKSDINAKENIFLANASIYAAIPKVHRYLTQKETLDKTLSNDKQNNGYVDSVGLSDHSYFIHNMIEKKYWNITIEGYYDLSLPNQLLLLQGFAEWYQYVAETKSNPATSPENLYLTKALRIFHFIKTHLYWFDHDNQLPIIWQKATQAGPIDQTKDFSTGYNMQTLQLLLSLKRSLAKQAGLVPVAITVRNVEFKGVDRSGNKKFQLATDITNYSDHVVQGSAELDNSTDPLIFNLQPSNTVHWLPIVNLPDKIDTTTNVILTIHFNNMKYTVGNSSKTTSWDDEIVFPIK